MTLISTTQQPYRTINVDAAELEHLTRQGLISTPGLNLYVLWEGWPAGPPVTVTAVSVTIRNISNTVVLATTSTGVTGLGDGRWAYRWLQTAQPGPGTYTVTWAALDQSSAAVSASETFTI